MTREENIRAILECNFAGFKDDIIDIAVKRICELEQEQKTGHWIATYGNVKCSVCGRVNYSRNIGRATRYCDFCGAKMKSEGDNGDDNS